ncbi:hypothetical protein KCP75_23540 [Salmonella enterica subsp. enterica]|nr:hypothetical protein KCP75_23540 [Salmonella enterica subsp. enterica]
MISTTAPYCGPDVARRFRETRFIASLSQVTEQLQQVLRHFDSIVGDRRRIPYRRRQYDTLTALRRVRQPTQPVCNAARWAVSSLEGNIADDRSCR